MSSPVLLRVQLRTLSVITICILVVAVALLWPTRPHAASPIVVNSLADVTNASDGLCTLREAITAANNNTASGGVAGECAAGDAGVSDVISFSVTGTINLSGVLPDINGDVSLTGPGSAQLTIRRNTGGDYRIFSINNRTVLISGLTITNGKTADGTAPNGQQGGNGGGILQTGGVLNLTDVIVSSNQTGNGSQNSTAVFSSGGLGGDGGGIYSTGTLTATNLTVTGNTTGNGGPYAVPGGGSSGFGGGGGSGAGIYTKNPLTLTNSVISNNVTGKGGDGFSAGAGGQGGGIWSGLGTLNLQSVVVSGNRTGGPGVASSGCSGCSSGVGGGIIAGGGASSGSSTIITLNNVTIANNATGDSPGEVATAAGMYVFSGTATLTGCTVRDNHNGNAINGGGGRGGGIANGGTLTVINSLISGNSTGNGTVGGSNNDGGGIQNFFITTLINCTVTGNSTGAGAGAGGGINNAGKMTIVNSTVTGNFAANNSVHGVVGGTTTNVINSIIARNGPGGSGPDVGSGFFGGTFTSLGHNLIGNGDGVSAFVNGTNGDQVGTTASPLNPQLGPLANNGGATLTQALLSTSSALDAGDNCVTQASHCGNSSIPQLSSDQRGSGFSRIIDGPDADSTATVDIGAFEAQNVLANLSDVSTNEDIQIVVPFDAGDTTNINSVTASSSNGTLVPNDSGHLSAAISGSTGIVTITPATNLTGTTNITVTLNRTSGTEMKTFMLTVNPVNDAPTFTKGPDLTVNEDAGAQTVNNWVTNISPGAADESAQNVTIAVTGNTNPNLFSVAPAISANSTLTYTPAANANGSATITVTASDDGGTANGGVNSSSQTFTITVNAVNDVPSFTKGADRTINEDAGAQSVFSWATGISAGPSDESAQTLTFQVTNNTNPGLFSTAPAISSNGTLTFTAIGNGNGTAVITIVLKDSGGTANGGVDTSAPQSFTITVNSVNDAPSFTRGANQTVLEDAGSQTVANWATAILPGPANESGQTVSFSITSNSNSALFAVAPAVSPTGTLTYTPAANANGTATIFLVIKDDGGTANFGTDTSSSQSFTITVTAVNDVPSFTAGPNQTVNEDAGVKTIANWATSISPGPNESSQTISFTATNDNNALFSAQPAISTTGTLTYTPAANAFGTATVSVTVKDNGGVANGGVDTSAAQTFTINVNSVNDAPSFTKGTDQTVNNNAGAVTVNNWATNISPGPANESGQSVSFLVLTNSNPGLFATAPSISPAGTLTYQPASNAGGTTTITVAARDDGGTTNTGVDTSPSQSFSITVNAIGGSFSFVSANLNPNENSGFMNVTVKRTGDLSLPATVDYATSGDNGLPCSTANGVASPKCDFTAALGTLNFAALEDQKTFTVLIDQDTYAEGPESFTISLSNPTGGSALGAVPTTTVTISDDLIEPPMNAVDDADVFVRQHYHDFLNREADGPGLAFWVSQITSCGSNVACLESRRVNVSAAFFLSIEFQQTGYLVERIYKSSYGEATGVSTFGSSHQLAVPIVRFDEFLKDTQRIGKGVVVLQQGWEQVLENNKAAYAQDFVQTSRFASAFPNTISPAQFVDQLFANAGVTPTTAERNAAIAEFGSASTIANPTARARALRDVADNGRFMTQEFDRAFVLMSYFGYLRRNPDDSPEPTLDYTGYDFWLTKLRQFNGDYVAAESVKAFLASAEYRQRFGAQ